MEVEAAAAGPRRRRSHSAEFKAKVIAACSEPGVSVAAVALANGLNANLLRCWLRGRGVDRVRSLMPQLAPPKQPAPLAPSAIAGFVPVQLQAPVDQPATARDIRLELRRGAALVHVNWPVQEAAACGAWLREWLR